jgi:lysozyme family protein
MNFDQAFDKLIGHEGGYVNDRNDPGGETRFGISKRSYPGEDIANLTLDRARELYARDFWGPAGCDAMPDAAKLQVFDTAVNSGVKTAIRLVQKAVGTNADGVLGPITLQAIQSMPAARFIARFNGQRLEYMTGLATWASFGRGWARRVAANLMEA